MVHEYSPVARMHCTDPHGLKCRLGPCTEVAGAMSASREPCTVVRFNVWVFFFVWQHRLHTSPPANELSWLLESKHLATPVIGNLAKAVSRYVSQGIAGLMFKHNRGNVKLQSRLRLPKLVEIWITSNTFSWLVRLTSNKQAKLRVTLRNLFARFSAKHNIDRKN